MSEEQTMGRLHLLSDDHGQSPWLDNLKRSYLSSGELVSYRDRGVRGLTSNPSIFEKAIQGSDDYDQQFSQLISAGRPVIDAYWDMVTDDIRGACELFAPVHLTTSGLDGFVSVEVDPRLARDPSGTLAAARELHERLGCDNVMIKIPATSEGLPAIEQMIAEGRSTNVTLIFSLDRYQQVMDAYITGLERRAVDPAADLSQVSSVASFFISRVDVAVDRELESAGTEHALSLRGTAAIAQAQLAYRLFRQTFSGPRWETLAARGARVQRPLWASTGRKNPDYSDVLYVDRLIGPDTVNTLPEDTLEAFCDHGSLDRTIDADTDGAERTRETLIETGVDLDGICARLEAEGVDAFVNSFDALLASLDDKAAALRRRSM